jgi:small-conductance mechanosensitive channel
LFIYFSRSNNSLFSLKNNVKIMCFCYVFQEKVKIYFLLYIDKVKISILKFEKREKLLSFNIYIYGISEFGTMFLGLFSFFLVNFAP